MLKRLLARLKPVAASLEERGAGARGTQPPQPAAPPPAAPPARARRAVIHPGSDGRPFPLLAELVAAFSAETAPQALVFGDSVMERVSRHDADTRTLGEMIAAAAPHLACHIASRTALNPSLMRALLRVVRRLKPPRHVVLPVNMRAFSPQWDLSPAWTMHQELALIDAWLSEPDVPIAPLFDLCKTEDFYASFDRTPVHYPLSELSTVGAFRALIATSPEEEAEKQRRKREIFVFHYTHPLVPSHRKLIDLVSAAELCRAMGAEPLVYATPINAEVGNALVGEAFGAALAANIATVRAALLPFAELHDYSRLLSAGDFFAEDLATEHLNEVGRGKLARQITAHLP